MRALVLSSGGSRGQYHIGALRYLYKEHAVKHQIICGTSIGAIIGSYIAQYPYGQETFAIDRLAELFERLTTADVYTRWHPWGVLAGLFNRSSFYNSAPLRKLISTHIDVHRIRDSGRQVRIGATHIQPTALNTSGISNYNVYTEKHPDLLKAIMASAAFAPFFEGVELDGSLAVDGGVQTVTPIKAAIEAGATNIDVVICYPMYLTYPKTRDLTAIHLGLHVIDLMVNRLTWIDIERTLFINSLVQAGHATKARYVALNIIHPDVDLEVNSLEFLPKDAARLQKKGWDDAKLVLK